MRPDLALISVDALRADALDCYGGHADLGAEVCALGDSGARYVWAFAAASSGGPAAASLMTSLHPSQHGLSDSAADFLREDRVTLAEQLREAGYATAAFVASPELNRSRNLEQGFDVYDDALSFGSADPAESVGDRALRWVGNAPSPWFVWVHFSDPHPPRTTAGRAPDLSRARYEASIRRVDRRLSQLIALLDARTRTPGVLLVGLHGRTHVAAADVTDHGLGVDLAEIRVPLLWRPPPTGSGPMVGRRIVTPVSAIDVAPTLLDAAGLAPPPDMLGRPLPLADPDDGEALARPLFAEHASEIAVVLGPDYAAFPRPPVARAEAPAASGEAPAALGQAPAVLGDAPAALGEAPAALGEAPAAPGQAPADLATMRSGGAAVEADAAARTARLWPAGDRKSESLPRLDAGTARRERLARLTPAYRDFLLATSARP